MASENHGLTHELLVERGDGVFHLSGRPRRAGSRSFRQTLTPRAATFLWYHLTKTFLPGQESSALTSLGRTASLSLPDHENLTTHIDLKISEHGLMEIIGSVGADHWAIMVTQSDAQHLWGELDIALYPVGWQGRESKPGSESSSA